MRTDVLRTARAVPIVFGLLAASGFGIADFFDGLAAKRNPALALSQPDA